MYVDLSVPLNQATPVYPGDPATKIEPAGVIECQGCNDHYVSTGNHTGTHVDAPFHMLANGKRLSDISVDQFIGRGRLIEVGEGGFNIAALERADIAAGDIVLFRAGMGAHYHEPIYFETYPVMSEDVAHYLVNHQVKMVGVDAGSVDNAEHFPIHKILLGGGVLVIENLTHLEKLTKQEFKIYALPINLEVDGAPARVIAEIA